MKVSVIVTTYNRPDALRRVLDALLLQTEPADEIIVADDGSGPETARVVNELSSAFFHPVHHVWQEDLGFRAARIRNRAIVRSTGDYIVLLDGDCIPEKHFVEDHLRLAQRGHFFQGKRLLVGRKLSSHFCHTDVISRARLFNLMFSKDISNRHHLFRLPFFPATYSRKLGGIRSCNMGIFRDDLFEVNGFNEEFVGWGREDSELAVRLYRYGLKRKTHPFMAICFHLWHEENERKNLAANDELLLRVILESTSYVCERGISEHAT